MIIPRSIIVSLRFDEKFPELRDAVDKSVEWSEFQADERQAFFALLEQRASAGHVAICFFHPFNYDDNRPLIEILDRNPDAVLAIGLTESEIQLDAWRAMNRLPNFLVCPTPANKSRSRLARSILGFLSRLAKNGGAVTVDQARKYFREQDLLPVGTIAAMSASQTNSESAPAPDLIELYTQLAHFVRNVDASKSDGARGINERLSPLVKQICTRIDALGPGGGGSWGQVLYARSLIDGPLSSRAEQADALSAAELLRSAVGLEHALGIYFEND